MPIDLTQKFLKNFLKNFYIFVRFLGNGKSESNENPYKIKGFKIGFIFTNSEKNWKANSFGEICNMNYVVIRHYYK